jgi:transketolase
MASGSEVALVMQAADRLGEKGIAVRVISMPSWELFEQQPESYRHQIMPPNLRKRIAVEAGATLGWYKYTGLDGTIIGLDHFGASAPAEELFEKFGLTPEAVVTAAENLMAE